MRKPFYFILLLYMVITLFYGIINPLFEAPDEHFHYFTAQSIVDNGRLPVADPRSDHLAQQEAAQPPLYYLLSALLISPIDTADAAEQIWLNPHVLTGFPDALSNKNMMVHTEGEKWPWQGYVLAAHLLRIFSTLLGAGTLYFLYQAAKLLWPENEQRALLAVGLTAFLPQFNFLHATISNDTLIILFCTAALFQLLRLWRNPINRSKDYFLLGLTVGFAIMSKLTGLLLLIYLTSILLLLAWREKSWKQIRQTALYFCLPAMLLGGWVLWRNWQLYGDPTATSLFIAFAGGDRHYSILQVLGESEGLWRSIFAIFGWFNIQPAGWIHWSWQLLVAVSIAGTIRFWTPKLPQKWSGKQLRQWLQTTESASFLLLGWLLLVYAGLAQFMLRTPAAQGRLLFPAIICLSLGLAFGLSFWSSRLLNGTALLLACCTTVYSLFWTLPQAYALPQMITYDTIPETATLVDYSLGQGLSIAAVEVHSDAVEPGGIVELTVYWRGENQVRKPLRATPEYVLEIFGRDLTLVGKHQSYPGNGRFPSSLWPEEMIIVEPLKVQLSETMVVPTKIDFNIKLANSNKTITIGFNKGVPASWPPPQPVIAHFGDAIELTSAHFQPANAKPGDVVIVKLDWQIKHPVRRQLLTAIHWGPVNEPPILQADGSAVQGNYPPLYWNSGERFSDRYELILPAGTTGRYPIQIGLYDPETLIRLPVLINGERQDADTFVIGELDVSD